MKYLILLDLAAVAFFGGFAIGILDGCILHPEPKKKTITIDLNKCRTVYDEDTWEGYTKCPIDSTGEQDTTADIKPPGV